MNRKIIPPSQLAIVILMLSFALLACNLFSDPNALEPTLSLTTSPQAGAPTVTINSPANNAEVVRGQPVLVQSTARHQTGVTRVELRVDGFVVNTVASETTTGNPEFSVIQTWTPAQAGSHTVAVIAYAGSVASQAAQITVTVRESVAQITATSPNPVGVTPITQTDNVCRARVDVDNLNFRAGPGTGYAVIAVLTLGNTGEIVGRLGDNTWWQLRIGVNQGWVNSGYTTETGDCSRIPVIAPPASPTPRPSTATPTYPPTSTPIPGTATPTLTPTATVPDLVITSMTGPTALNLNASGTVGARYTLTVRNQGTGTASPFSTSFRQPDGTVVQLREVITNLGPGQSIDLSIDVTFTASNVYQLQAFADSAGQVAELDEGNNVRTIDVIVTIPPTPGT